MLDVGCGTGAFSIGAALRGYTTLGLSWDERNQRVATERAALCGAKRASFEVSDIRKLDERRDLAGAFEIAICCEAIEHVIDDRKLLKDVAGCLKPGGRVLLTTPYEGYVPMGGDEGPFRLVEDGAHVRKGYSASALGELCEVAGLRLQKVSFCSGLVSQKLTKVQRMANRIHPLAGWTAILPFRLMPPVLDPIIMARVAWPFYSICLEATKPRLD